MARILFWFLEFSYSASSHSQKIPVFFRFPPVPLVLFLWFSPCSSASLTVHLVLSLFLRFYSSKSLPVPPVLLLSPSPCSSGSVPSVLSLFPQFIPLVLSLFPWFVPLVLFLFPCSSGSLSVTPGSVATAYSMFLWYCSFSSLPIPPVHSPGSLPAPLVLYLFFGFSPCSSGSVPPALCPSPAVTWCPSRSRR